jgi:predicted Zn finger-like uncharacterized protein
MLSIKCPKCRSSDFVYKSDTTGNARLYRCKACGGKWLAIVKSMLSSSAMSEPSNLEMKNLEWIRVLQ